MKGARPSGSHTNGGAGVAPPPSQQQQHHHHRQQDRPLQQQHQQQQPPPPAPASKAPGATPPEPSPVSSHGGHSGAAAEELGLLPNGGAGVPVVIEDGSGEGRGVTLRLHELGGFRELWRRLAAEFPGRLPPRGRVRLAFLDAAGDWVLVTLEQRWGAFVAVAHKVAVCA